MKSFVSLHQAASLLPSVHGYPSHPRSNQSTPLSSRDYNDPRRNNYGRNQAPRYNTGGYQGNRPTLWSHTMPSYRGPGSSQPHFSRSKHHNQSRDPRQHQTLFGLHKYRASYCPLDLCDVFVLVFFNLRKRVSVGHNATVISIIQFN